MLGFFGNFAEENILAGRKYFFITCFFIFLCIPIVCTNSAKVKIGRTVYLTINTAEMPKVAIPDIIDNSSYRQAEARLRALGFKLTAPEIISGEKDWVYAVKCLEKELTNGEKIPRESVLTLIIGDDEIKTDSLGTDSLIISTPKGTNPVIDDSWF